MNSTWRRSYESYNLIRSSIFKRIGQYQLMVISINWRTFSTYW